MPFRKLKKFRWWFVFICPLLKIRKYVYLFKILPYSTNTHPHTQTHARTHVANTCTQFPACRYVWWNSLVNLTTPNILKPLYCNEHKAHVRRQLVTANKMLKIKNPHTVKGVVPLLIKLTYLCSRRQNFHWKSLESWFFTVAGCTSEHNVRCPRTLPPAMRRILSLCFIHVKLCLQILRLKCMVKFALARSWSAVLQCSRRHIPSYRHAFERRH
jgi:hypothetical protein